MERTMIASPPAVLRETCIVEMLKGRFRGSCATWPIIPSRVSGVLITTINSENGAVFSSGLASKIGFDLLLPRVRRELETAANLLRALVVYLEAEERSIKAGETIDWDHR